MSKKFDVVAFMDEYENEEELEGTAYGRKDEEPIPLAETKFKEYLVKKK